jgi:quercetin dioxygenase-like cupin family protein
MSTKTSWALVLLSLLAAASSAAQDPTKVEPTHYRLGFENEHVQVVYIHYGPHEKSALHDHPPGVVVNLTNGHLRFVDQNGNTQEVRATHGEARWFPAFKHRVENLSDTSFDGIYIAVKGIATTATAVPKGDRLSVDGSTKEILHAFLLMAGMSSEEAHRKLPGLLSAQVKAFKDR